MHSNGNTIYDFSKFTRLEQLINDIYVGRISTKQVKDKQNKMNDLISPLNNYNPHSNEKIKSKSKTFNNASRFFDRREIIIKAFEDGIFPLSTESLYKKRAEKEKEKKKKTLI